MVNTGQVSYTDRRWFPLITLLVIELIPDHLDRLDRLLDEVAEVTILTRCRSQYQQTKHSSRSDCRSELHECCFKIHRAFSSILSMERRPAKSGRAPFQCIHRDVYKAPAVWKQRTAVKDNWIRHYFNESLTCLLSCGTMVIRMLEHLKFTEDSLHKLSIS